MDPQKNKRRTDKTKTKLTETNLITPTSIHTDKTKHQNKVHRIERIFPLEQLS